jgi:serine/threonine protein kinase
VYKGVLPDQRQIAVKKLKGVSQGEGQFWAEVTIIGRIHHLNLVRMWGFCTEGEHRLLVYEYIPNGSLDKYLFNNQGKGETVGLEWSSRYRIAVGVARAIAYLHEECLEWVLHRDIKPENILLDESFCPKISDFGLAKLVDREHSLDVSNIKGTPGYLAPEYWMQKNEPITAKADVYSFGIVLLQIVSGRKNICFSQSAEEGDNWFFPKKAFDWVVLERNVEEVVDKCILSEVIDDRLQLEAIERMVKTAFWCIQSRADDRPSMGKVAKMLQGTLDVPQPPKPDFFVNFLHLESGEYGDQIQEMPPPVI